jgi:hypothetical protein
MGATRMMNRSAKGGARSSLHYGDEGVLIHPPHQGVCGRHGTEEQRVTSGALTESSGELESNNPISGSNVGSDALSVVGPLQGTLSAAKTVRPSDRRPEVGRGRRRAKAGETRRAARRARAMRWISSLSEKPLHHRPRILAARINLTGVTRDPLGRCHWLASPQEVSL